MADDEPKKLHNFDLISILKTKEVMALDDRTQIMTFAEQQMEYFGEEVEKLSDNRDQLKKELDELEEMEKTLNNLKKKTERNLSNVELALGIASTALEMGRKGGINLKK